MPRGEKVSIITYVHAYISAYLQYIDKDLGTMVDLCNIQKYIQFPLDQLDY